MQHETLAVLVELADEDLGRRIGGHPLQFHLYAALRREQRAAVAAGVVGGSEPRAILSFARSAYDELCALLIGREVLDSARDGEWTIRDLLRHSVAVELRYCAQVLWSATRGEDEPLGIPEERLPCDRLAPPEPEFVGTKTGDMFTVLELLGGARDRTDAQLLELPAGALARPSLWGRVEIDVRERIHQIAVHLIEVLIQAEKMVAVGEPEARRIVRRICAVRGLHEAMTDAGSLAQLDGQLTRLAHQCSTPER